MLTKRFDKRLETLLEVRWTTDGSADRAAKRYKYFIKDDKVYSAMERIDDLYVDLLTKLSF